MSRFWRALLISAATTGAAWALLAWWERQRGPAKAPAQGAASSPVLDADGLPEARRDQMLAELDALV